MLQLLFVLSLNCNILLSSVEALSTVNKVNNCGWGSNRYARQMLRRAYNIPLIINITTYTHSLFSMQCNIWSWLIIARCIAAIEQEGVQLLIEF